MPLFTEVVKKALKQPPSSKMIEKVKSGKVVTPNSESCEKVNNGYICVDNFGNDKAGFSAELYVFANEQALQSHLTATSGRK